MALHIALLDPQSPDVTGAVAVCCAAVDAALHLVGPLGFTQDDPAFASARPPEWDAMDWWHHPRWRDFRDAMSRERCLYFAVDGARDPADAPFRANSVLVFGSEALELPDRIREKYPDRIFRLPRMRGRRRADLPRAVEATLALAADTLANPRPEPDQPAARAGRRRAPSRRGRGRR
jgi:tRNA (cytidine/uridine-2'-O-)-methyltransferase